MSIKDVMSRWGLRVLMCLSTSVTVSFIALVCAWQQYGRWELFPWNWNKDEKVLPTFWEFISSEDTAGIQTTCLLAGVVAFPLCLIASSAWRKSRAPFAGVLLAHVITAVFAIAAAVWMAALHLPSGH
jgi:hypothetical protein